RAGVDAAGGTVVVWTDTSGTVQAASATPGGAFGAPQTLATGAAGTFSLAVAPDGRALVAVPGNPAQLAERAPGEAAFGAPGDLSSAANDTAVALRPDGAAIAAWGTDGGTAPAQAQVRSGPGAFGAPQGLGVVGAVSLGTVGVGVVSGTGQEFPLDSEGGSL